VLHFVLKVAEKAWNYAPFILYLYQVNTKNTLRSCQTATVRWLFCHRVCQRWKRIISDKFLWKEIDLSPYSMKTQWLKMFARRHFTSTLLSLHMKGSISLGMLRLCSLMNIVCKKIVK